MEFNKQILVKRLLVRYFPFLKYRLYQFKNYSLNSGERQTGEILQNIRQDHIARYELAANIIKEFFPIKISTVWIFFAETVTVLILLPKL